MITKVLTTLLLASLLLAACAPANGPTNEKSFDSVIDLSKVTLPQGYSFQPNGNSQVDGNATILTVGAGAALAENPIGWILLGGAAVWSIYAYNNPAEAERAAQDLADGAYLAYVVSASAFSTTINDVLEGIDPGEKLPSDSGGVIAAPPKLINLGEESFGDFRANGNGFTEGITLQQNYAWNEQMNGQLPTWQNLVMNSEDAYWYGGSPAQTKVEIDPVSESAVFVQIHVHYCWREPCNLQDENDPNRLSINFQQTLTGLENIPEDLISYAQYQASADSEIVKLLREQGIEEEYISYFLDDMQDFEIYLKGVSEQAKNGVQQQP